MNSKYGIEIPEGSHYTVYKLTDPEGKVYIGCTGKPVEQRWKKGYNYRRNTPIGVAIAHFGWEAFEKSILCENLTKEGGEKLEKWFVEYYDSMDPAKGYNRMTGGARKGAHMSEITKKISSDSKNRLYAERPEVIEKIRHTVTAMIAEDPSYRERVGKGVRKAYEKDPTIRIRLREAAVREWRDPAYREKMTEARASVRVGNTDLAERSRASQKRFYAENPDRREEVRRQMREYLSRPENRAFVEADCRAKPVKCVETGEVYRSQWAAEKATGFYSVHKVCQGKYRTCGGYHWRYLTEEERVRCFGSV